MTVALSSSPETAGFDARAFRKAVGHFATGVTVMTASADGVRTGVTANSFSSLSLDPPLVLWSIVKTSNSFPVFEAASHFAVNILAHDQIQLSQQFAKPAADKFTDVDLRIGAGGCLILPGVCAVIQCARQNIVDGGDHWILIGRVCSFETTDHEPLLYHRGNYSLSRPHPAHPLR